MDINRQVEALLAQHPDTEAGNARFTASERQLLAQYSGAGGKAKAGARGQGLLYEYYTPPWLCEKMWQVARHHGGVPERVLEPSAGTGNFLKGAGAAAVTAFEVNPVSARICRIRFPEAEVHTAPFEAAFLEPPRFTSRRRGTWLGGAPFDLVIGNPPYGQHTGRYAALFKAPALKSFEVFFLYWGLELVREGGLLVYVIPSSFLRSDERYARQKRLLGERAELLDAYRLPAVFDSTSIGTDVVVLRKTQSQFQ